MPDLHSPEDSCPSRQSVPLSVRLWRAGLLGNLHDATVAIVICTSGWEQSRFFASHAARRKALQCLRTAAESAAGLDGRAQARLPGIAWHAWEELLPLVRRQPGVADQDCLWEAMTELVPATLLDLQRYRRQQPELFSFRLD